MYVLLKSGVSTSERHNAICEYGIKYCYTVWGPYLILICITLICIGVKGTLCGNTFKRRKTIGLLFSYFTMSFVEHFSSWSWNRRESYRGLYWFCSNSLCKWSRDVLPSYPDVELKSIDTWSKELLRALGSLIVWRWIHSWFYEIQSQCKSNKFSTRKLTSLRIYLWRN